MSRPCEMCRKRITCDLWFSFQMCRDAEDFEPIESTDILTQIKMDCEKLSNNDTCVNCKFYDYRAVCVARQFANILTGKVEGYPFEWDIEEIRRRLNDGKTE